MNTQAQAVVLAIILASQFGCEKPASKGPLPAASSATPNDATATAAQVQTAVDLSTPEKAVLSLEEAYRNKDLQAALKCKDFQFEATLLLDKLGNEFSLNGEMRKQTAETLELAFRSQMTGDGFPNFSGITSTFGEQQPYEGREDMVRLEETCKSADGTTSVNKLVCAKTAAGWKVVTVIDQ